MRCRIAGVGQFGEFIYAKPQDIVPIAISKLHRHGRWMVDAPVRTVWREAEIGSTIPDHEWWQETCSFFVQRPEA